MTPAPAAEPIDPATVARCAMVWCSRCGNPEYRAPYYSKRLKGYVHLVAGKDYVHFCDAGALWDAPELAAAVPAAQAWLARQAGSGE